MDQIKIYADKYGDYLLGQSEWVIHAIGFSIVLLASALFGMWAWFFACVAYFSTVIIRMRRAEQLRMPATPV